MCGRGKFIVIEGLDGVGKTTFARRLVERMREDNLEVSQVRQPGGTPIAESIRTLIENVQHHPDETVDNYTTTLLFYASRNQLIRAYVEPTLNKGIHCVTDRHDWSTISYQGVLDEYLIKHASRRPDLIIHLDMELERAIELIEERGGEPSAFETPEWLAKAKMTYDNLAHNLSSSIPYYRIDKNDFDVADANFERDYAEIKHRLGL